MHGMERVCTCTRYAMLLTSIQSPLACEVRLEMLYDNDAHGSDARILRTMITEEDGCIILRFHI